MDLFQCHSLVLKERKIQIRHTKADQTVQLLGKAAAAPKFQDSNRKA